ncbi:MAG: transposase [Acidobacteriia bacterium]|nr:transposase [Terriglobia bacterium]
MPRPWRIQWEGCWYHVTSRGNGRGNIFHDDEDRLHFLGLLGRMTERFRVRLHVYALMDNHYHWLLQTLEANLSRAMQWFNSGYSSWFNRRHRRPGHLLQGRYKAIVVQPEQWGLELSRYVHLNPIRVERFELDKRRQRQNRADVGSELQVERWKDRIEYLRNYRWSSYRAYVGLDSSPSWLNCAEVLSWMRAPEGKQRRAYQQFVEAAAREGLQQTPWRQLQAQVALGDDAFIQGLEKHLERREPQAARVLRRRPDFETVVGIVEGMRAESWEQFSNRHGDWGRELVLCLAHEHCELTLQQLGRLVGKMDYSAVSKAIERFRVRMATDRELAALVAQATTELSNVPV